MALVWPVGTLDGTCPTCCAKLAPVPPSKAPCPDCGAAIFHRRRPFDDADALVNDGERREIEIQTRLLRESKRELSPEEIQRGREKMDEHRTREMESLRKAADSGLIVTSSISTAPQCCDQAKALSDRRFSREDLPHLPLPGCYFRAGCPCCFTTHVENEDEIDAQFEAALEALPVEEADAVRYSLITAFGGEPVDFEALRRESKSEAIAPAPIGLAHRAGRLLRKLLR